MNCAANSRRGSLLKRVVNCSGGYTKEDPTLTFIFWLMGPRLFCIPHRRQSPAVSSVPCEPQLYVYLRRDEGGVVLQRVESMLYV